MIKEDQIEIQFRDLLKKKYLLEKFKMEALLKGYSHSEVHCITYIGSHEDSNVTKLAAGFQMTRGAISKITQKLITKGLVESYRKPDNRKEIYFKLTETGKKVFQIHEDLHIEFQNRDRRVFERVPEDHIAIIMNFLEQYNRHLENEIREQAIGDIPTTEIL